MKFTTLRLDDEGDALVVLDQRKLPGQVEYLELRTLPDCVDAIQTLAVRGAPAIGIAAAYALYLAVKPYAAREGEAFFGALEEAKASLAASRPTAVNLFWALDRMEKCADALREGPTQAIVRALHQEALAMHREDTAACRAIGDFGLSLLRPGMGLLTHCNAGALAATAYGTALSPIYRGQEKGYAFRVYADETRPLLQGARLTAWELCQAGVNVTVACDGMGASLMQRGLIDAVIVGCDRLAANGDAANKVGTASLAAVAKAYGVPFYVAAPVSTIDLRCATGRDIVIEERDPGEVTSLWYERPMAPEGVKVYNPAFDVAPAEFIRAVVTERGILYPPFGKGIKALMGL